MRIATWNVNSLRVRLPQVVRWLGEHQPDVLLIQETKLPDDAFPADAFADIGYRVVFSGQKTYNGVAIASLAPATGIVTELPGLADPQRRVLMAEIGGATLLNLYVPNGQEVGSDKYRYKLEWLSHLREFIESTLRDRNALIAGGDFNVAPADQDVHDPARWQGKVLCSAPERAAFAGLLQSGLADCFRLFEQPPQSFTWWDYRAAAFRRNRGLRIDHILADRRTAATCRACRIDREPRGWDRPSDHTPVIAEFDLQP